MNFEAEILEETYFDLCTIKRKEKVKNTITGVTETIEVVKAQNVKCAVSKNDSQSATLQNNGVGSLVFTHKLFTNPKVEILEGDIIEVSSMGKISSYLASKSFLYSSHSEILVTCKERV